MTIDVEYPLALPTTDTPTPPTGLANTMTDRILMFCRGPDFKTLISTLAARRDLYLAAIEDLKSMHDIDEAEGVHLDRIGAWIDRSRDGASDERYRVLIKIQIELILSSQGTTPVIMRIVELFTGVNPTHYSESYPMHYTIGAQVGNDPDEINLLIDILRQATCGAYGGSIFVHSDESLVMGSVSISIPRANKMGSVSVSITDAGTMASVRRL